MPTTRTLLFGASIAAALLLLACGGGGGGDDGGNTTTVRILADPDLDGFVSNAGYVDFNPSSAFPCTGDRDATMHSGYMSRQLYAFHIGGLEASRIVRATLRLYQDVVVGNPYGSWGDVVVDHVDYIDDPGLPTYNDQELIRRFGVLSVSPNLGARTLDVTGLVVRNLGEGSLYSQFRIRFWHDLPGFHDDVNDYAQFAYAENPNSDKVPLLIVEYE